MIHNEREYGITRTQAERFERSLEMLGANGGDHMWTQIQRDAIRSQLDDLRRELAHYDARRGKHT